MIETTPELLTYAIPAVALGMAFIPRVAYEIGRRDRWTCQCGCGRQFKDGWLMDMAHVSELHQSRPDTNPNNGRCLASICHLNEHINIMQGDATWKNIRAVELRSQQLFQSGLHHRDFILRDPSIIVADRQLIVASFENRGFEPREFILNIGNPVEIV